MRFPRLRQTAAALAVLCTATAHAALKVGDTAPAFSLQDAEGNTVSLADYAGTKVIVYFYPKAMTPGCTTQACDFRDRLERFSADVETRLQPVLAKLGLKQQARKPAARSRKKPAAKRTRAAAPRAKAAAKQPARRKRA